MIRFALRCERDHRFESWFRSGSDFATLHGAGQVECPICASRRVEKAPMAPAVRTAPAEADCAPPVPAPASPPLPAPGPVSSGVLAAGRDSAVAKAIDRLRRAIEAETDYVGRQFAAEARAIHDGEAPERAIRGEATSEETQALLRDGIPVMPLPFRDPKKAN